MSKFGWSYPPGCSQADVDRAVGLTPEAEAEEDFREQLWNNIQTHMDDEAKNLLCDYTWSKVCEAYKMGYEQGQADAALAVESGQ